MVPIMESCLLNVFGPVLVSSRQHPTHRRFGRQHLTHTILHTLNKLRLPHMDSMNPNGPLVLHPSSTRDHRMSGFPSLQWLRQAFQLASTPCSPSGIMEQAVKQTSTGASTDLLPMPNSPLRLVALLQWPTTGRPCQLSTPPPRHLLPFVSRMHPVRLSSSRATLTRA